VAFLIADGVILLLGQRFLERYFRTRTRSRSTAWSSAPPP
jgi:hypothetical protein